MSGLGVGPVVISARGVTHVYGSGETRVRALDDVDVDLPGRAGGGDGSLGFGEVDPAATAWWADVADVGHCDGER